MGLKQSNPGLCNGFKTMKHNNPQSFPEEFAQKMNLIWKLVLPSESIVFKAQNMIQHIIGDQKISIEVAHSCLGTAWAKTKERHQTLNRANKMENRDQNQSRNNAPITTQFWVLKIPCKEKLTLHVSTLLGSIYKSCLACCKCLCPSWSTSRHNDDLLECYLSQIFLYLNMQIHCKTLNKAHICHMNGCYDP